MTHTYALLEVSPAVYDEIAAKLREAGYEQAFGDNGELDMHGIAIVRSPTAKAIMTIEWRKRPTIMDGEVITFSTDFDEAEGIFGQRFDARGPFEVSASRNAVIVHRAELHSDTDVEQFLEAVLMAKSATLQLSLEGMGGNYKRKSVGKPP